MVVGQRRSWRGV